MTKLLMTTKKVPTEKERNLLREADTETVEQHRVHGFVNELEYLSELFQSN